MHAAPSHAANPHAANPHAANPHAANPHAATHGESAMPMPHVRAAYPRRDAGIARVRVPYGLKLQMSAPLSTQVGSAMSMSHVNPRSKSQNPCSVHGSFNPGRSAQVGSTARKSQ